MQSCVLLFGPFVGDLISEITVFRPYIKWVQEVVDHRKTVVNTHSDRKFMYEDFDVFLPVDQDLTDSHSSQVGRMNELLSKKEYVKLKEDLKKYVCEKYNALKKDCRVVTLPYTDTSGQPVSMNQMIFDPIDIGPVTKTEHTTIIARDEQEAEWLNESISKHSKTRTIIDGVLKENGDIKLDVVAHLKTVTESKYVVSSDPRWLTVSIVQGVDTFGFGAGLGQLKSAREFDEFALRSMMSIQPDSTINKKKIMNQFEWFMENVDEQRGH